MSASPSATLPRAQRACSLRIGGLQAMTTLDYPDHLACVLFCQGCAWRCRYCHNPELIAPRSDSELDWQQVRQFLRRRQGLLQAVVFSGGEATLQPGLAAAMGEVRELGFKVGLHSAGIKPAALAEVLPLCDWVGFDVKAQAAHSKQITLVAGSGQANWQSLALLLRSGVAHECRTTVHWQLTSPAQLLALARQLHQAGVQDYVVQLARAGQLLDRQLPASRAPGPLDELWQELQALFPRFVLRE
ncbi:anaerobic ribonucleoside-triphosphate reductase activating protein [Pseudomonas fluvialis]|uniref:anaerobic ribonucleoside-triphosphate reductase activating protein n=1 Tax=Pseudomonas fluvialis TaxID=1793966 RepID=UPI00370AFEBA